VCHQRFTQTYGATHLRSICKLAGWIDRTPVIERPVLTDPIGLTLENFDGIGQWRNTDGGIPIDASGSFIDGTRFNGAPEFRAALLKYRDAYYSNITQHLLGYALGRKARQWRLHDYEMPSVRAILRAASANDYRWSSIISGIVKSAPFQMKNIVP